MRSITRFFSGWSGYTTAAIGVVCFVIAALIPFQWNPPRRLVNGAELTSNGTLSFSSDGFVRAASYPKWAASAVEHNRFKIHLRVKRTSDYGIIFSYADWDAEHCNIAFHQYRDTLVIAFRSSKSSRTGRPFLGVDGVLPKSQWVDIDFIVEPELLAVFIDGKKILTKQLTEQPLSKWQLDVDHQVTIGNYSCGTRPWLGEIARCTVETEDGSVDYLNPSNIDISEMYWVGLRFNSRLDLRWSSDNIANFVCFIPLGFILACCTGKRGFLIAILFSSLLSGITELLQVGFERVPSLTDWVMNTSGAFVGAVFARPPFFSSNEPNQTVATDSTKDAEEH